MGRSIGTRSRRTQGRASACYIRDLVRRLHHGRRALVVALAASVAIACRPDAQVTLRAVTLYVPKACPADSGAYAVYQALGDFEPTPPAKGHVLGNVGEALSEIDASARALVV